MNSKKVGKIESKVVYTEEQVKYVLYARKSMEQDEFQALSIDSQVNEMLQLAQKEKIKVVDIKKEAHSAKDSGQRPVFKEILESIRTGKYTGILTWAPDRLSRNAGDLGSLVDLMDQHKLVNIQTYTQKFTNDPSQKSLLMILCSQAKLENDNKSLNVKRGLRARVEQGLWPSTAPTGYLNSRDRTKIAQVELDPDRSQIIKKVFEHIGYDSWSGVKTYNWLTNELKFRTHRGKVLSKGNFYLMLRNTFYYGVFEYPLKSGNWYKGAHIPLITKQLYDLVQDKISSKVDTRPKQKEFAFTRLIVCGKCGGGVTAEEKFKTLVNGDKTRHVYYKCSRVRDIHCPTRISEKDLISKVSEVIDKMEIDQLAVKEKIQKEVDRFQKFQSRLLSKSSKFLDVQIDLKEYVKFVLEEGELEEKRGIMSNFCGSMTLIGSQLKLVDLID